VVANRILLVETAQRFTERFYQRLADGDTIAEAHRASQESMARDDSPRGDIAGHPIHLEDWFITSLYQVGEDARLVDPDKARHPSSTETKTRHFPPEAQHEFVGREAEKLMLARLFAEPRAFLLRGMAGMGKTVLAMEVMRWFLKTGHVEGVLYLDGKQSDYLATITAQLSHLYDSVAGRINSNQLDSILSDHRFMIVADNLEADDDENLDVVRQLKERCRRTRTSLLCISRQPIQDLLDIESTSLSGMHHQEAMMLLKAGIDSSESVDANLPHVVDLLNGHPASLSAFARNYKMYSQMNSVEVLTDWLSGGLNPGGFEDVEESITGTFLETWKAADTKIQDQIGILGRLAGRASTWLISRLFDAPKDLRRQKAIQALEAAGLLHLEHDFFLRWHPALGHWVQRVGQDRTGNERREIAEALGQLGSDLYQIQGRHPERVRKWVQWELPNFEIVLRRQAQTELMEEWFQLGPCLERLLVS
ncbi:MAG: ATP-binding protein, partial [Verrucomicrobiota bacterium]